MKKKIILICLVLVSVISVNAQTKYLTRTGTVNFFSSTSVEDIEAINTQASSILKTDTKDIVINVLMRSFKFDKALMEEHFNEKYVESETYPSAKFKGKIVDDIDFSKNGKYDHVKVQGTMMMHGVNKEITIYANVNINTKDGTITCKCNFLLNPDDYNIEIPNLVKDKISNDIKIEAKFIYKKV